MLKAPGDPVILPKKIASPGQAALVVSLHPPAAGHAAKRREVSWCFSQDGACYLRPSGCVSMLAVVFCLFFFFFSWVFSFHCNWLRDFLWQCFSRSVHTRCAVVSCFIESGFDFPVRPMPALFCRILEVSRSENPRLTLSPAALREGAQISWQSGWCER